MARGQDADDELGDHALIEEPHVVARRCGGVERPIFACRALAIFQKLLLHACTVKKPIVSCCVYGTEGQNRVSRTNR